MRVITTWIAGMKAERIKLRRQLRKLSITLRLAWYQSNVRMLVRRLGWIMRRTSNGLLVVMILAGILAPAVLSGMFSQVSASSGSQGPRTATSSGNCVNDTGTGTVAWTSPGNAFGDDSTYASVSVDGTVSNYIKCTNFGFTIPSNATITGITVTVERKSNSTGNGGSSDSSVRILRGGFPVGADKATATVYTTSDVKEDHGGSSDLWSTTWAYSDINSSSFGAFYAATKANAAGSAHSVTVDVIQITVDYTQPDYTLTQSSYRWFENTDSTSVGSVLGGVSQDTAGTAKPQSTPFRLRMTIHVAGASLTAGSVSFKLQSAPKSGTCDTGFIGEGYTDVGSSVFTFYDNPSVADGATPSSSGNDPSHSGHTNIYQGYEEANNAAVSSTIAAGQDGVWDFALVDNGSAPSAEYCFRMVLSTGSPLDSYNVVPEIAALPADLNQTNYRWYGGQGGVPNNSFLQVLGENDTTKNNYGNGIRQTSDGGYIMVGSTESYGSGSGADLLLTKLDNSGMEEWSQTLGASSQDDSGNSVIQTPDGGYVVTGTTGYGAGTSDIWLSKFDSTGVEQWTKTLGGTGDSTARAVIRTADDGFVVAGSTTGYGAGNLDVLLAKFSNSGAVQWVKTLGGSGADEAYDVVQTADGGYAVTGYTGLGSGSGDVLLARFDSTGVEQWTKTLGGSSSDKGYALALTADGGFAVAGSTASGATGNEDLQLSQFSSSGVEQWTMTFTSGASSNSRALSLTQSSDGGFAVAGARALTGHAYDVVLAKFTNTGEIYGCPGSVCISQAISESNQTVSESNQAISESNQTVSEVNQSISESSQTSSTTITVVYGQMSFGVTLSGNTSGYDLFQADSGNYLVSGSGGIVAEFNEYGVEQASGYVNSAANNVLSVSSEGTGLGFYTVGTGGSLTVRSALWLGTSVGGTASWNNTSLSSGTLTTNGGDYRAGVGTRTLLGATNAYVVEPSVGVGTTYGFTISAGTVSHGQAIKFIGFDEGTVSNKYVMTGDATYTTQQVLLTRLDVTGFPEWVVTLAVGDSATGYAVSTTNDGGYIVAGSTITSSDEDILLSKFDSEGAEEWTKTLSAGSGVERAYSVIQTFDGGYVVAGYTTSVGAGGSDILLAKFSSDGTEQWTKTIGSSGTDEARSIIQSSDGALVLTGSYNSVLTLIKTGIDGETAGCASGCTYQSLTESNVSVSSTGRLVSTSALSFSDANSSGAEGSLTRSESYFLGSGLWTETAAIPSGPLGSQDTAGVATRHDAPLRLRGVMQATKDLSAGVGGFKLQVAARVGTCDTSFTGESYADVGPSAAFDYYNNSNLTDGVISRSSAYDPTVSGSLKYGRYIESANFTTNQFFGGGAYSVWDFSVTPTDTAVYGAYCFRIVYNNNTLLHEYAIVPEILLPPAASQQMRHGSFFDSGSQQPIYW